MPMLNVDKALRSLRKTPVILNALLKEVSQAQAQQATDGQNGWSVLFIVCHMSDFEDIFYRRVQSVLEQDCPRFPPVDQESLALTNDYAGQDFRQVLETYLQKRQAFIQRIESLTEEQLTRHGIHPETGDCTVLDIAINAALHDVNHLEQIVRALRMV